MSESNRSGRYIKKRLFPVFSLFAGLILLWIGNQEYLQFRSEVETYVTARPGSQAIWFLIFGTAASVAGIVGLLRGRVV